jgi:hypothetical protein
VIGTLVNTGAGGGGGGAEEPPPHPEMKARVTMDSQARLVLTMAQTPRSDSKLVDTAIYTFFAKEFS